MGTDVELLLPPTTRVDDFARVLARVLGHPVAMEEGDYGPYKDIRYAHVIGVRVIGDVYLPTNARIRLVTSDTEDPYYEGLWEFETPSGWRSIYLARSTPLWCAAGDRLWRFFGGKLKYQDETPAWDRMKDPVYKSAPATGDAWVALQTSISNVPPLTPAEVSEFEVVAAYDEAPFFPPFLGVPK